MIFKRSLGAAFCNTIAIVAIVVVFFLDWKIGYELTFPNLFSALEIMSSLKFYTEILILAFFMYEETKIAFGRFATVFNIKKIAMNQIKNL